MGFEEQDKFEEYNKALKLVIKTHIDHLNYRCVFDFTEEQIEKLSDKLIHEQAFDADVNRFFQVAIEEHSLKFKV